MRPITACFALLLSLLPISAEAYGDRLYGAIITNDPTTYIVRLQTDLTIPTGVNCKQLRVWHANPAYKPWSFSTSPFGATDLRCEPQGKIETETDKRSTHFYFEDNRKFTPNTKLKFISSFRTNSVRRSFNPNSNRCSWGECKQYYSQNPDKRTANAEVAALVQQLKQNQDPTNIILSFCRWLRTNIQYDAGVSYGTDDTAAILSNKRGHCGHIAQLFHLMCNAVDIKSRDVVGLNLADPNGKRGSLADDFGNKHNWAEVYFPNIGWIEVEPTGGDRCYTIEPQYIQNNTSFQNAAVWVTDGSGTRQVKWENKDGRYQCAYNATTLITFTEDKH